MLAISGISNPCITIRKERSVSLSLSRSHARLARNTVPVPRFVVRAGNSDGEGEKKAKKPGKRTVKSALDEALEELQKKGMTPAKAREILKVWAELGAKDPVQLKELLVKRSMKPVTGLAFQTFLDSVAAIGGFYTGNLVGQADFTGSIFVSLAIYFFAFYYFIQAGAELTALVSLIAAARKYSTNTEALLAAVQQLAGPASGLGVLNSVQLAVNTYKIIQTLDSLSESLKVSTACKEAKPGGVVELCGSSQQTPPLTEGQKILDGYVGALLSRMLYQKALSASLGSEVGSSGRPLSIGACLWRSHIGCKSGLMYACFAPCSYSCVYMTISSSEVYLYPTAYKLPCLLWRKMKELP